MKVFSPSRGYRRAAFTLVEVMVSLGIVLLISILLVSMVDTTKRTWVYTQAKTEQFREARKHSKPFTGN